MHLNVIEIEKPVGIIVQFGGQTPLKLALPLLNLLDTSTATNSFTSILGTSPISIDKAEDREQFESILRRLDIRQPKNGIARTKEEARMVAKSINYPVVVRPSYVLGGRAMEIVYEEKNLNEYFENSKSIWTSRHVPNNNPILLDSFLEKAKELL